VQDSFDARMKGNAPEAVKTKSNKGWMVAAIVLLVGVVALGVTEFLAYQEIAKKDKEIAELKTKSSTEEDAGEGALDLKGADFDGAGLAKTLNLGITAGEDYKATIFGINALKISKDGKYLYTEVRATQGLSSFKTIVYRTLPDGEWKNIGVALNSVSNCKDYSKEALEVMIDYGNGNEGCMSDDWKPDDELMKIGKYYEEKYKEEE
jgi:hypothetical protein